MSTVCLGDDERRSGLWLFTSHRFNRHPLRPSLRCSPARDWRRFDPDEHTVSAYRSLTDVREFSEGDVLIIEDVLPGFSVPVINLFSAYE